MRTPPVNLFVVGCKLCNARDGCLYLTNSSQTQEHHSICARMADVETTQQPANGGGDSIVDDGEEAESKAFSLFFFLV